MVPYVEIVSGNIRPTRWRPAAKFSFAVSYSYWRRYCLPLVVTSQHDQDLQYSASHPPRTQQPHAKKHFTTANQSMNIESQ